MQLNNSKGAVAAGHRLTVESAENVLREGGNAFDAALAAYFTSFVCEPVLSSPGGGGFMLAHQEGGRQTLYDFFVQTPVQKKDPSKLDFYPIEANFGTARQEFHIGAGSIATPGSVKGIFAIYDDLCTMPLHTLAEQAIALSKEGLEVNAFQSQVFEIIKPIYSEAEGIEEVFEQSAASSDVLSSGVRVKMPLLADFLDNLVREGESLFYDGEICRSICEICEGEKGHVTRKDLQSYKVVKRKPLETNFLDQKISINCPPSSAGVLISYALRLFEKAAPSHTNCGSTETLNLLYNIMKNTHEIRRETDLQENSSNNLYEILDSDLIKDNAQLIRDNPGFSRGTTHISVADAHGNIAALSTSNGEGCGHYIPGTGIMLNNMLGEEDLNAGGFHAWQTNRRMTSMMAPGIASNKHGDFTVFGSGGSNRIRTAILQVLLNMLAFEMTAEEAVNAPRIHVEPKRTDVEYGFGKHEVAAFLKNDVEYKIWPGKNLYFGGVHVVQKKSAKFYAFGDPRRGGHAAVVGS